MAVFGLLAVVFAFTNGELSPSIYTSFMVMLACFGYFNGFVTARYLKFFGYADFKLATSISALVLPAFIIGVFFAELLLAYIQKSALRFSAA